MSSSTATGAASDAASNISMRSANVAQLNPSLHPLSAQFREIHKNTWLKRLTAEGKKITVGPKKSERSWVVFCVHDDTEAMLEGYAEPRQAPAHSPEWIVSLRHTLHVSHALIPNSHEFEFVVALNNEVVRFHATSWEIMQEWVETLRAKLREMKILSPRENLYTKLPEIRMPLLPTRDPTSPLPAPPPVPAALVPGVEQVVPHNALQAPTTTPAPTNDLEENELPAAATTVMATSILNTSTCDTISTSHSNINNNTSSSSSNSSKIGALEVSSSNSTRCTPSAQVAPITTSMSNTLTQNLLNMLTDPMSTYSEHLNSSKEQPSDEEDNDLEFLNDINIDVNPLISTANNEFVLSSPQTSAREQSSVNNSIRVDVNNSANISTEKLTALTNDRFLPRLQTTRSLSVGSSEKTTHESSRTIMKSLQQQQNPQNNDNMINNTSIQNCNNNITELQIDGNNKEETNILNDDSSANITIIEVSASNKICEARKTTAEFFQFPDSSQKQQQKLLQKNKVELNDYKCNVQIIPSNANNNNNSNNISNNNSSKFEVLLATTSSNNTNSGTFGGNTGQITTVHVAGEKSLPIYGTCYTGTPMRNSPQLPKRIILTANTSGVTNITVNDKTSSSSSSSFESKTTHNKKPMTGYYEKVFLSSSSGVTKTTASHTNSAPSNAQASSSRVLLKEVKDTRPGTKTADVKGPQTSGNNYSISLVGHSKGSNQKQINAPTSPPRPLQRESSVVAASPQRRAPMLMRGATEAVIMRASRRDVHMAAQRGTPIRSTAAAGDLRTKSNIAKNVTRTSMSINNNNINNNNDGDPASNISATEAADQSMMQRRRSASTSEARNIRNSNNNEQLSNGIRMQAPPQRYPNTENNHLPETIVSSPKRMTLREQQVMQLRREIMHPGGVRLQLRRKDCVGSIAWVDCFSTVWVAGWKQKEHPVLYNALHIGDQLLSIAGIAVTSATEANKIIRNANTLFVEVLVRRIPFGRGYAIRRDREGQCLGLIRDGNTSTIVDVVPNSLAARHGLPPKAQSCDGSSLTFWVLTEINGRTLNLFFKDNEIRDRLNSVGRDISILVQPADLITKLKKQLKSMRGYKDYLVQ